MKEILIKKGRLNMITVGMSKWPTESGYEVGKRSLEMKLPPDFVQVIGPYFGGELVFLFGGRESVEIRGKCNF